MTEKQHITITIADVAPLDLNILRSDEALVRDTVNNINKLWAKWSKEYSNRSSKEILAMVAYDFAKRYYKLLDKIAENEADLEDVEKALDKILLDIE